MMVRAANAVVLGLAVTAAATLGDRAEADIIFTDNFNNGASPLWGNEVGNWTASGGVYYAQQPSNNPATYSSLPFNLGDMSIDVDINKVSDGGIWLHSSNDDNGILLVTGGYGHTGTGFYWHIVQNGVYSAPLDPVNGLFQQGDNIHVRVVVSGDTYSAYFDGGSTPVTTLTDNTFPAGKVALYDYSTYPNQTFDNVVVATPTPTPEPATLTLAGIGGVALIVSARRRHRASTV